MRKIILLCLIMISSLTYGQKLVITPNGLKNSIEIEKSYIVININGLTSKQLYDKSINYINKNYKNPNEVIKGKIEGEYLKFDTYVIDIANIKQGFSNMWWNCSYTTEIYFKDDKIKYEIISLEFPGNIRDHSVKNTYPLLLMGKGFTWYIFNMNGELKRDELKIQIETYFNDKLDKFKEFLSDTTTIKNENW